MNAGHVSIKDVLYEEPGPKLKKRIKAVTFVSMVLIMAFSALILHRFYITGQFDRKYWYFFGRASTWSFLFRGLVGTVKVAIMSGVIAFIMGFFLMIGRISRLKAAARISRALIEFTRGVPTLLFVYFFFLVAPQLGMKLPAFFKIALPVALSACGVVAEVLRSGVNAVPKGQREAALSLGMVESQVFLNIVFPQAIRYVIPALISELVIVVKDTTFAYVVNYPDLMQNAGVLISNYDAMLSVYLLAAVIYIIINYFLNKAAEWFAVKDKGIPG